MIAPTNKYYVSRKERQNKRGGGVCALISRQFTVNLLETADDVEILAFDILLDAFNYRCILCYTGAALAGGVRGSGPPSLGQGHSRVLCKSDEFF